MKKVRLFVTLTKGQTVFRVTGQNRSFDRTGSDPASTYNYSVAKEDHYANVAHYVKLFEPDTIEIRNELLS
jgi:hypothetical protein